MMKPLDEMTLEELWQLFPIILKDHNADYANWYTEEKQRLEIALGESGFDRINHIGSTAVKGLIAKPIIDILLEVGEHILIPQLIETLQNRGWLLMYEEDKPLKLIFNKGYTPQGFAEKVYHLHVRRSGDWDELYFRDYLNEHPDVQREYEALKLRLKAQYEHNRDAYTEAKTAFIQQQTKQARMLYCNRYR